MRSDRLHASSECVAHMGLLCRSALRDWAWLRLSAGTQPGGDVIPGSKTGSNWRTMVFANRAAPCTETNPQTWGYSLNAIPMPRRLLTSIFFQGRSRRHRDGAGKGSPAEKAKRRGFDSRRLHSRWGSRSAVASNRPPEKYRPKLGHPQRRFPRLETPCADSLL